MNWLEHFSGDKDSMLQSVVNDLKNAREVKKKQGLAICSVKKIHEAYDNVDLKGRVIHTPNKLQTSYSRITKVTSKDIELSNEIHSIACQEVVPSDNYV